MENTSTTKAYDAGYDYYISGGRGQEYNLFPPSTTRGSDWLQGYQDAERRESDRNHETFSDNCSH